MSVSSLAIRDVEVEGRLQDVIVAEGRIVAMGPQRSRGSRDVLNGRGGALLPGLHDHHVHLNAMAAARGSVDVGPATVQGPSALATKLLQGPVTQSGVRAVGYHEDVAGPLDRHVLDTLLGEFGQRVPVRVQHRSGSLWVLNTVALRRIEHSLKGHADLELGTDGTPNGRLWRLDHHISKHFRSSLQEHRAAVAEVAAELISVGVTGVSDASPEPGDADVSVLSAARPLKLTLMCARQRTEFPVAWGARKVMLRDHDLPDLDLLCTLICEGRDDVSRAVAVHCVSVEALVLCLAAFDAVGVVPGDRLEHGALIPDVLIPEVARLGLAVVTQPDFVRTRGDEYVRHLDPADLDCLYRWRTLERGGVTVVASSDAPYASADPWQVIRSATHRQALSGRTIGSGETVTAQRGLASYLRHPLDLTAPQRRVAVGETADLCLLDASLSHALQKPHRGHVAATLIDGQVVFARSCVT